MKSTAMKQTEPAGGVTFVSPSEFFEAASKRFDAVAQRAFELFEGSGHNGGHELDDWLKAEAEVFHPVHLEIAEADNTLTVKAEVPGFSGKDLKVSVEPHRLTIAGKRETHAERKAEKTLYSERCSNEILRVVELPKEVDPSASGLKAKCTEGVLTVMLPEVPAAKGREIKIEA